MDETWIAVEAAARGIANVRRGSNQPTPSERELAKAAIEAALPYLKGAKGEHNG